MQQCVNMKSLSFAVLTLLDNSSSVSAVNCKLSCLLSVCLFTCRFTFSIHVFGQRVVFRRIYLFCREEIQHSDRKQKSASTVILTTTLLDHMKTVFRSQCCFCSAVQ